MGENANKTKQKKMDNQRFFCNLELKTIEIDKSV